MLWIFAADLRILQSSVQKYHVRIFIRHFIGRALAVKRPASSWLACNKEIEKSTLKNLNLDMLIGSAQ